MNNIQESVTDSLFDNFQKVFSSYSVSLFFLLPFVFVIFPLLYFVNKKCFCQLQQYFLVLPANHCFLPTRNSTVLRKHNNFPDGLWMQTAIIDYCRFQVARIKPTSIKIHFWIGIWTFWIGKLVFLIFLKVKIEVFLP